ncbi:MAG: TIGR04376 family protein [Cyanobacteria bacterium P01_E01_bin.45]
MTIIDDLLRFLETRLEEFLRAHPKLELQALEEQLRQQEADTTKLIAETRADQQRLQQSILATAQEIKLWHERVEKARKANRLDLAQGAQQREADLLNQGNQLWGQMQGAKERLQNMEELLRRVQQSKREVRDRITEMARARQADASASASVADEEWSGWSQPSSNWSDLEKEFQRFETDLEFEAMKQQQNL